MILHHSPFAVVFAALLGGIAILMPVVPVVEAQTVCNYGEACAECTCTPGTDNSVNFCNSYDPSTHSCAPWPSSFVTCTDPMWHKPCYVMSGGSQVAGGCECQGFNPTGSSYGGPVCEGDGSFNGLFCPQVGSCGICVPCDEASTYAGGDNHDPNFDEHCGTPSTPAATPGTTPVPTTDPGPTCTSNGKTCSSDAECCSNNCNSNSGKCSGNGRRLGALYKIK